MITQPYRHLDAILWNHIIYHIFRTRQNEWSRFSVHKPRVMCHYTGIFSFSCASKLDYFEHFKNICICARSTYTKLKMRWCVFLLLLALDQFRVYVPQSSVVGPLLFLLYISPLSKIIDSHQGIQHAMYADDTPIYITLKPNGKDEAARKLSCCLEDIRVWPFNNRLKSEMIHITS